MPKALDSAIDRPDASAQGAAPRPRQRFAKGHRPFFMKDPDVDKLLAIVTAQAAEISVLRERLDTHERLAVQGVAPTPANIDAYRPDSDVEDWRDHWRASMLKRVFRILSHTRTAAPPKQPYQELVQELSEDAKS